ncbi:variant erythrocyte surface antigen-1 family protein [Babesia caballi]|uniref:Variant erythrocyte surface antigen-1 family protein n=1 Tax=Babesia caballi TaxID=5871 RepID=A0AAV4LQV6_BABCB|nr:variant erythrocyte surface antigen-1 family protein [Babesia caballi]
MSTPKQLTDCPSNLKEAIDWILRVTGKDGQSGKTNAEQLADAVTQLLKDVESSSSELESTLEKIKVALKTQSNTGIIDALGNGLNGFMTSIHDDYGDSKSVYDKLNGQLNSVVKHAGDIFISCIPMVFYGLGYLHWKCSGQWYGQKLTDNGALRTFMTRCGFVAKNLSGYSGSNIATSALGEFQEFQTHAAEKSYAEFLQKLQREGQKNWQEASASNATQSHFLSGLYLCSTSYFRHHHQKNAAQARPPSSIREMLYWLSGLTVTPQFDSLLDHLSTVVPADFKVAISGSGGSVGPQTLSADELTGHLVMSCLLSPAVIGAIQGSGESSNPFLHDIYCASEFLYPSSATSLFNVLGNYSYALQFQLLFLYQQCGRSTTYGCAWQDCKYGSIIQSHSDSHICPSKCTSNHATTSEHISCTHNCSSDSPLQAFLTDNLKGFSLPSKSNQLSPNHLMNHPPGSMCHVKMGFADNLRSDDSATGKNIYNALRPFCGSSTSPVRQLCEKLGCLTQRPPRLLGELFGFYTQLVGQAFNTTQLRRRLQNGISSANSQPQPVGILLDLSSQNSLLSQSFKLLTDHVPFWDLVDTYGVSGLLASSLYGMASHCHEKKVKGLDHNYKCSSPVLSLPDKVDDLYSLFNCDGQPNRVDPNNGICGQYLFPLVYSTGATFALTHSSSYLSWFVYLTDDLQSKLEELFEEFKTVECPHNSGTHTTCICTSVVQCGGVLSLIYRHGFNFHDAYSLNGWQRPSGGGRSMKYENNLNRNCNNFQTQLSNVLAEGAPLHNLLLAIDEFLYYVRFRFMSMVSSFWLCSLAILLYFIFYGIDVLHFKSHVRFPSSHTVPPIGLLTTGKAPVLTKLTYYMP